MIQLNSPAGPESETVRQTAQHVMRDLVTMGELQIRLFKSDAMEFAARSGRLAGVFAAGIVLLLVAVPLLVVAIAEGLVAAGLPRAAAYAIMAILAAAGGGGMMAWAWQGFRKIPLLFVRSRQELRENIASLKDALQASSQTPPNHHRKQNYDRSQ